MFVTSDPAEGCAIALDLMDAFSDDQIEPSRPDQSSLSGEHGDNQRELSDLSEDDSGRE